MAVYPAQTSIQREPDEGITIFDHGANTDEVSVVRAHLHGTHIGGRNRVSTTAYVVTSGSMKFSLDGVPLPVAVGDIVVAPPNAHREMTGECEMIIVNTPKWDAANETD